MKCVSSNWTSESFINNLSLEHLRMSDFYVSCEEKRKGFCLDEKTDYTVWTLNRPTSLRNTHYTVSEARKLFYWSKTYACFVFWIYLTWNVLLKSSAVIQSIQWCPEAVDLISLSPCHLKLWHHLRRLTAPSARLWGSGWTDTLPTFCSC